MNCESVLTGDAAGEQCSPGARFLHLVGRLIRAKHPAAEIEGNPIDASGPGPLPEAVLGVKSLFDSDNPQVFHLQIDFLGIIDRDLDALERRMDRALKILVARRRAAFTVVDGGRHD